MIRKSWWFAALLALAPAAAEAGDYVVVISKKTASDGAWKQVADTLAAKHGGMVIEYEKSVEEAKAALAAAHPRYTCFVATSAEATREFVAGVHRLARAYDEDPWTDTIWGIVTGYDAANAMAIARHAEPLTVRKVAGGTEIALEMCDQGLWYDELVKNKTVAKKPGAEAAQARGPDDTTRALAQTLTEYHADLFITSGHATERDWQIGFRYRNGSFVSDDGKMYGQPTDGQRFPIASDNPKVYLPIGNCLMGNINGPDAMALAWMNSCGVKQMIGYTVPTWYGYAGWGMLDYFVEQPGRYTMAEAFVANQQALLHRLYAAAPQTASLTPAPGQSARVREVAQPGAALGVGPQDVTGLLHDRDTVAFYGDPRWEARMAVPDGVKPAYGQVLTVEDGVYTLTITPNRGAATFKPVNTNGSQRGYRPIVQLLDHRIVDVELTEGHQLNALIADDFILIPSPRDADPGEPIVLRFKAKRAD